LACAFGDQKPFFKLLTPYSALERPTQTTSGRYSVSTSDGLRRVFSFWMSFVDCCSAEALMAKAQALGQAWMKGVASEVAKAILHQRPT